MLDIRGLPFVSTARSSRYRDDSDTEQLEHMSRGNLDINVPGLDDYAFAGLTGANVTQVSFDEFFSTAIFHQGHSTAHAGQNMEADVRGCARLVRHDVLSAEDDGIQGTVIAVEDVEVEWITMVAEGSITVALYTTLSSLSAFFVRIANCQLGRFQ